MAASTDPNMSLCFIRLPLKRVFNFYVTQGQQALQLSERKLLSKIISYLSTKILDYCLLRL